MTRTFGMNAMTRVIGAALLALRALSCPVRLGSLICQERLGRYSKNKIHLRLKMPRRSCHAGLVRTFLVQ